MYRKTVQCYVFLLTLLDISLNNRLTAQGKSHDVSVHDSLIEGITFQEWGKESSTGGSSGSLEALRLSPASLSFGRAPLAAAHRLTVTLTNTANTTVHLASVAGTTPDFHASFFESKTLPPAGNTTFSVVYLGRREGPVSAHLYIHTSLGVHKYPVSAEGVASEWGVWPLVGLRVPLDASLEPLLELYNPTDQPVQVSEVYSSGGWVSLSLPDTGGGEGEGDGAAGGGGAVAGEAWRVPPRESRPLVKLRLRPPHPPADRPRPAYIRIKGDMVGGCSGGLVVAVEAVASGAGAYLTPPQLRLRIRGSRDPPATWEVSAGNSGATPVELEGAVWGARCSRHPPPPLVPPTNPATDPASAPARANGARAEGATVRSVLASLPPHQEPVGALHLTLNYERLWASYEGNHDGEATEGAWCSGWVVAGGAAMPYSVRLLKGTLSLHPPDLDIVTGGQGEGLGVREVRARNDFPVPVHLHKMHCGSQLAQHFECTSMAPIVVGAGREAVVGEVRPRARSHPPPPLRDVITLHTNLTTYTIPVTVHTGTLELEWEWPNSSDGVLRMGTVGAMSTRRVGVRVHNRGPRTLCATAVRARLPSAAAALAIAPCARPSPPPAHACRCIAAGQWAQAWLTVVAPAQEGVLEGSVWVGTGHATTRAPFSLRVRPGIVHAPPLRNPPSAPYVHCWAPLVVESTMAVSMRLLEGAPAHQDPNMQFIPEGSGWVSPGRGVVGRVLYAAERGCHPVCYTGLDLGEAEGVAWSERGSIVDTGSLLRDVDLMRTRKERMRRLPPTANITLRLHTTEVVQIPVTGSVQLHWPLLATPVASGGEDGGGGGVVAGVGEAAELVVAVRNPAATPLLIQAVLHKPLTSTEPLPEELQSFCSPEPCVWSEEAFELGEWVFNGDGSIPAGDMFRATPMGRTSRAPAYLVAPGANFQIKVKFTPTIAAPLATYLYLRNNLTIVEVIPIWGRGAHPSFELGGRRPNSGAPLSLEVTECAPPNTGGAAIRRQLAIRNTGPVPLRLRDWRISGTPCSGRGFRLHPCTPLSLQPNETRALRLSYHPDYTVARASAPLTVRADAIKAEFRLRASAPARVLRLCSPSIPRPPFESPLRAAGAALALAALALVIAAAALDAERALRRARNTRPPPAPPTRAPLDLRAAARSPPPPPTVVTAPRRRPKPRRPPPPDPRAPLAERRAFERWRAEVLRRAEREDDRSSEEGIPPQNENPPQPEQDSPPRSTPSPVEDDAVRPSSDEAGRSGDSSVGSDSSPGDDLEGRDDSEPDATVAPPRDPPPHTPDPPDADAHTPPKKPDVRRECRPRRDVGDLSRRCTVRVSDPCPQGGVGPAGGVGESRVGRAPPQRTHARRDKNGRRRLGDRAGGTPPRTPPVSAVNTGPTPEARAPPALRWGATWSSVVAAGAAAAASHTGAGAGAPLPPIGSDVRRRAEERADQSLFYFNGEQPAQAQPDAFAWRSPPLHDYLNDFDDANPLNGGYGSVWAGGAWAWGGGLGVRPPPGFGSPPAPPPAPRAYDPFRSLAAIWAPGGGALDWRSDSAPAPSPQAPPNDESRPDE